MSIYNASKFSFVADIAHVHAHIKNFFSLNEEKCFKFSNYF